MSVGLNGNPTIIASPAVLAIVSLENHRRKPHFKLGDETCDVVMMTLGAEPRDGRDSGDCRPCWNATAAISLTQRFG
ncbi:hypothetical protein HT118_18670 [Escherichia coli]|nr:hypothetical protein [Escherichia coli]